MEKTNSPQNNAVKAVFIIICLSSFSKGLGLIRESALAANFGANYQTDAFKVAFEIPSILLAIVSFSIATSLIPIYTEYIKNKTKEQGLYFINNIFNIVLLISVGLTIFEVIFAPFLVRIIAPGFKGEIYDLTSRLIRIMFPCLVFFALSNLANGYLQAHSRFTSPAFMWIPYNVFSIVSILFFYRFGIEAVAIGSIFAVASLFITQVPSMIKAGYRFIPVIDFKEEGLRKIIVLILPILVSSAFGQVYILIDRILASGLNEGSISALDYANKVNNVVYGTFIISVVTVFYPSLSFAASNIEKFIATITKGIKIIILISIPMTIGILILRLEIVKIIFERGAFESKNTSVTAIALACFSIGTIGMGMREMLSRAFYSIKDTKTPMINGITAICINIALDLIFVKFWGVGGLAAATSLTAIISGGMLLFRLNKRLGGVNYKDICDVFIKTCLAAVVMGGFLVLSKYILTQGLFKSKSLTVEISALIANILMGGGIYLGMLRILKISELDTITSLVSEKVRSYIKK